MSPSLYIILLQGAERVLTGIGEDPDFAFSPAFLFKIILAIGAGFLIGMEREYKGKDAGLKTNMLVSVGACVFIFLSLQYEGGENVDMTRVLGQVVTGIGFLGAGVILKKGGNVQGLTTAATLWCSAAAGCLAGLYMVMDLILFTLAVVLINIVFGMVGKKMGQDD